MGAETFTRAEPPVTGKVKVETDLFAMDSILPLDTERMF